MFFARKRFIRNVQRILHEKDVLGERLNWFSTEDFIEKAELTFHGLSGSMINGASSKNFEVIFCKKKILVGSQNWSCANASGGMVYSNVKIF